MNFVDQTWSVSVPRFSFGIAKVDIFSLPPNFSLQFFTSFLTKKLSNISNSLNIRELQCCYNFVKLLEVVFHHQVNSIIAYPVKILVSKSTVIQFSIIIRSVLDSSPLILETDIHLT